MSKLNMKNSFSSFFQTVPSLLTRVSVDTTKTPEAGSVSLILIGTIAFITPV